MSADAGESFDPVSLVLPNFGEVESTYSEMALVGGEEKSPLPPDLLKEGDLCCETFEHAARRRRFAHYSKRFMRNNENDTKKLEQMTELGTGSGEEEEGLDCEIAKIEDLMIGDDQSTTSTIIDKTFSKGVDVVEENDGSAWRIYVALSLRNETVPIRVITRAFRMLKLLRMRYHPLSALQWQIFGLALSHNNTLVHLDFTQCGLGDYSRLVTISVGIAHHRLLRNICLSGNMINTDGLEVLAKGLTKSMSVRWVDLSCNSLTDISSLIDCLRRNAFIETLILRDNRLSRKAAEEIGSQLFGDSSLCQLKCLDLSMNEFDSSAIASLLKTVSFVELLDLSGCRLNRDVFDRLVSILKSSTQVVAMKRLILSDCKMDDACLAALSLALQHKHFRLSSVCLDGNKSINLEAWQRLARLMSKGGLGATQVSAGNRLLGDDNIVMRTEDLVTPFKSNVAEYALLHIDKLRVVANKMPEIVGEITVSDFADLLIDYPSSLSTVVEMFDEIDRQHLGVIDREAVLIYLDRIEKRAALVESTRNQMIAEGRKTEEKFSARAAYEAVKALGDEKRRIETDAAAMLTKRNPVRSGQR